MEVKATQIDFKLGRSLMKAVTSYFLNLRPPDKSFHRFVLSFLIFMMDLTFGRILNALKESHSR